MAAFGLSDRDALGVAARELEHARIDQPVMDDRVRLVEKAMGAQGQKLRIAGTGTHEIDDTRSAAAAAGAVDQGQHGGPGPRLVAREDGVRDRAPEELLPEAPARKRTRNGGLGGSTELPREAGEAAKGRGQKALDREPDLARKERGGPTRRDRDEDG